MRRILLLMPTRYELRFVPQAWIDRWSQAGGKIRICGFGAIEAGILTNQLCSELHPEHVVLGGIAGSFELEPPIGESIAFTHVASYGIGVGSGKNYQSARSLGWSSEIDISENGWRQLDNSTPKHQPETTKLLLSATSASADIEDAENRRSCFPQAIAEDMEGYSVALACVKIGIPCSIIKGISNQVGNRDHRSWRIEKAIASCLKQIEVEFMLEE
jgi:futalosine hydrolase